MKRRLLVIACLLVVLVPMARAAETLPAQMSDQEFWKLSSESSEADGMFRSDNLLSNESYFQYVIPTLNQTAQSARVYMGVGPEQNFNYIAALRPKMVFIVDVRRGNMDLQLMYKALFELSSDRAEFVSRLFSKRRPATLTALSTPEQIFQAFGAIEKSETLKDANLLALRASLTASHHFALDADDWKNITDAYAAFYTFGPEIRYSSSQGSGFGGYNQPSYADLM